MQHVTVMLASLMLLSAPAQLQAQTARGAGGSMPALDIENGCKTIAGVDEGRTLNYGTCVADERTARAQLQSGWSSYSAEEKERCVGLVAPPALPSYVTLQGCMDMGRAIGQDTKNRTAKRQPNPAQGGP
jgi:hypothetical protein